MKRLPAPLIFAVKNSILADTPRPVKTAIQSIAIQCYFIVSVTILMLGSVSAQQVSDQQKESNYRKVVTERSAKIISTLGLTDSTVYYKALDALADQYIAINAIHDRTKAALMALKSQALSKEAAEAAGKKIEDDKILQLRQRHQEFIAHLEKILNRDQLEKIKDGMTYRVLPITFEAYQEMILTLTKEQKDQIYTWLVEARELAMDEGSSDDKHKMFGKYKGRINNYLSAVGYDLKKETEAWQQRLKEKRPRDQ